MASCTRRWRRAAGRERAAVGPTAGCRRPSRGSGERLAAGRVEARDRAEQAVVYGWRGSANSSCRRPRSTMRPAYSTLTSSHSPATTPRSWVIMTSAVPVSCDQLLEQGEDLGLDRHVERGGRLVGDEQPRGAGERHRDERALPHPAAHLVRVVLEAPVRVGDADPLEQVARPRPGGPARHAAVALEHLGDLEPHRHDGVQRRERVLEDHRDVAAPAVAHLALVELEEVGALEGCRALDRVPALGEQPHDRERGDRLAAAGLADEPDRLPRADVEAHAVDGPEGSLALSGEGDPEVADRQQRLVRAGRRLEWCRRRGHQRVTSWSWGRGPRAGTRP